MIKIHHGYSHLGHEQSPKRGNVRPGVYRKMNAPLAFQWDSGASHTASFEQQRLDFVAGTRLIGFPNERDDKMTTTMRTTKHSAQRTNSVMKNQETMRIRTMLTTEIIYHHQ